MRRAARAVWARALRRLGRGRPTGPPEAEVLPAREAYDLWAPSYDAGPNPFQELEDRVTGALLPEVEGRAVLDAGCGLGRWSRRLAARGAQPLVGVDLGPAMLGRHRSPARLAAGTVGALPLRGGVFDLVLCALVLGHQRDSARVLAELIRVLRPGGILVLSDFHPEAAARGWRRSFATGRGAERRTVAVEHHPRSLEALADDLARAGCPVTARDEARWRGVPVVFALRGERAASA